MTDESEASQGEGQASFPPNDGSWIPKERFDEVTGKMNTELAELRGRVEGMQSQPKPDPKPERTFTRSELDDLVNEGKLSQRDADQIHEQQFERKVEERVGQKLEQSLSERDLNSRIDQEMQRYFDARPEVNQEGSDLRNRLQREFQHLVSIGQPDSRATELAALRTVLGPAESLRESSRPETHQETGGSQEETTLRTDGIPKGMSQRERSFYQKQIDKGLYPDWKAVEAEMKHANPNLRKRMGAR